MGHLRNHDEDIDAYIQRRQDFMDGKTKGMPGASLGVAVRMEMLPTPMTTDYKQTDCEGNWNRHSPPLGTIVHGVDFGRFTPAIKRWEQTIGRPAPAPTEPDGKDGAHRLSARFTEWLMGLPDGYIVDSGLRRNEALKACGNGVVPQQAKLALEILDVKL